MILRVFTDIFSLRNPAYSLLLGLTLSLSSFPTVAAAAPVCKSPKKVRSLPNQDLKSFKYLCNSASETSYCNEKKTGQICFKVSVDDEVKTWEKKSGQDPAVKKLKGDKGYRSLLLASYTESVRFKKPLRLEKTARIKTGKYSGISLGKSSLFPKCFDEMLFVAHQLQSELSQFNFEIDGKIQSCRSLRDAGHLIIANKDKVKKNLAKIHSPLHTIYLTTVTKFNENDLGKMGLYVNVGKKNEVKNRLVDFKINSAQIKYETSRLVRK